MNPIHHVSLRSERLQDKRRNVTLVLNERLSNSNTLPITDDCREFSDSCFLCTRWITGKHFYNAHINPPYNDSLDLLMSSQ